MSTPEANATMVNALGSALRSGDHGLQTVPGLLKRVLAEDMWRSFRTMRGEMVEHTSFAEFVAAAPLRGIGASVELVRRIVADDTEAMDLLDRALVGPSGRRTDLGNNVPEVRRPEGNTQAKALRRLRKDAPELHTQVLAGNLTAHAAMVAAGFRPRTVSVPVERPDAVAETLLKYMAADDITRVITRLQAGA